MSDPHLQMCSEMSRALREFEKINQAEGVTESDRQQLKNAYLENYFEPQARELLRAKLDIASQAAARQAARMSWRPRKFKNRPATPGHLPDR